MKSVSVTLHDPGKYVGAYSDWVWVGCPRHDGEYIVGCAACTYAPRQTIVVLGTDALAIATNGDGELVDYLDEGLDLDIMRTWIQSGYSVHLLRSEVDSREYSTLVYEAEIYNDYWA